MRKKIIIGLLVIMGIVSVYMLSSKNNDFTTKHIDYNGTDLLISIDDEDSDVLPSSGDYYLSSYKCNSKKTEIIWDRINYTLSVTNGTSKGRVACDLNFSSKMLLSQVEIGSYVSYTGNNGCSGDACKGRNANYVSDTDMGYCSSSNYKYTENGWRIGYIEDDSVYLISGGALECVCINSDGSVSDSCNDSVSVDKISSHLNNLDGVALKYCDKDYAYGNVCDSTSSWSMDAVDFEKITGSVLSNNSCYDRYSNMSCGYNNALIDNGGYYWFASVSDKSNYVFNWDSKNRIVSSDLSGNASYGLRPVLRLDTSVYVTGGDGTYKSPYTISND